MIHLTEKTAIKPVDFRRQINGLVAHCKKEYQYAITNRFGLRGRLICLDKTRTSMVQQLMQKILFSLLSPHLLIKPTWVIKWIVKNAAHVMFR
jgi:hypothetical protein